MAGDIIINITAVDKASPAIKAISTAARKAAADLKKAGADGGRGLDEIGKRAKSADTQMRTIERTSLAVGAAIGTMAIGLVKASSAFKAQERQIDAINRMYGEASDEMLHFAEMIQLTTRFSNDAARESLVLLNTLTQNYGISQDQIEQLLVRSTDLAQLHGKTLTEVTQMVSNALRGEAEYIEQIGVTLNQTFLAQEAAARGMKNFISEMSAAEQAAFRFTVLMEQTAAAQGYAMESATGTAGAINLLINEVQDGAQAFGDFIGPVADVAAQFNSYALWLPLIFSQFGRVSAMLLTTAGRATVATGALKALTFAASPLGLILGGVAAAATVLGVKWLEERQASAQAAAQAEATADSYRALRDIIAQLYLSGNDDASKWASDQLKATQTFIDGWQELVNEAIAAEDEGWFEGFTDGFTENFGKAMQSLVPNDSALDRVGEALEAAGAEFDAAALEAFQISEETEQAVNASLTRIFSLLSNPNVDLARFETEFASFWEDLMLRVVNREIPTDQIDEEFDKFYDRVVRQIRKTQQLFDDAELQFKLDDFRLEGLDGMADDVEEFTGLIDRIMNAQSDFNDWVPGLTAAMPRRDLTFTGDQLGVIEMSLGRIGKLMESGDFDNPAINEAVTDLIDLFIIGKIDADTFTAALYGMAKNMGQFSLEAEQASYQGNRMVEVLRNLARGSTEAADSMRAAFQENMASFIDSYLEAFQMNDPVSLLNLSSLSNEFTQLAGDIANATSQLETVFRVIVGNTNAIGQTAQQTFDWAESLINVRGELGEIDRLLAGGIIDDGQYRAAQDAFDGIADANQRIQDSILGIQAIQAPFIEQFIQQQAVALESLKGQSAEQQRITLGWMDSATAAQAYQLIQQAVAVGNGELGSSGADAFEEMIRGAVAVNPFLFDMLETIGLLEGTVDDFSINFDGVTDGISEIEMLTIRIEDLIRALGGEFTPIDLEVNGLEDVEMAKASVSDLLAQKTHDIAIRIKAEFTGDYFTGDGTGQGRGLPGQPKAIKVPVEPDYSRFADTAPTDLPSQKVTIEPDTAALDEAIAAALGGEYSGPTFTFVPDSAGIIAQAQSLWSQVYSGPTFDFIPDTAVISSIISSTYSRKHDGPTFNFIASTSTLAGFVSYYDTLSVDGPTFNFQANVGSLRKAIGEYAGRTVGTAYINVQPRMGNIPLFGSRHGGIPQMAHGGILTRLAEGDNPEVLHFANGGQATVRNDGLYSVPPHTLVVPSNNDRNPREGITIHIQTGDWYGGSRPDLDEWAESVLIPTIASTLREQEEEAG